MADPAQTELDLEESAGEVALIPGKRLATLAGDDASHAKVVTFTLQELRDFTLERLHENAKIRSLDWALDEKGPDDAEGPSTKVRFNQYKLALEKLLLLGQAGKGLGKGGKASKGKGAKNPPAAVITVFKSKQV